MLLQILEDKLKNTSLYETSTNLVGPKAATSYNRVSAAIT